MDISKESKTALHKMIHQSEGITPKDIAEMLGDSHKTVLNYGNCNMESHLPSLRKFEAMLVYTSNPAMLKVWSHKLGLMLVPVKDSLDKEHQMSVLESLLHINIGNGQINQHVHDVLADGVVTPTELEETMQILEGIESNIHALRTALESESKKYLSALQIKKALAK